MIEMALPLTSVSTVVLGGLSLVQHRRLHAARHDPLTCLPTRRLWTARAERASRRPHGLVLLLLDADQIKPLNDRYGHDAGDAVLAAFAQRLQTWVGPQGLAGRIGGDEFAAFRRLADDQHLAEALEQLSEALSIPVTFGQTILQAGASIGAVRLSELPEPGLSQAMTAADQAMYLAKHADGGGTWHLAERHTEAFAIKTAPIQRTRTHGMVSAGEPRRGDR